MTPTDALQRALANLTRNETRGRHRHETILCLRHGPDEICAATGQWQGRPVDGDTPFHTASAAKLLGTAMALRLVSDGVWRLDDPVAGVFPPGFLDGLHRWQGQDMTGRITLRHLLSHSSGLPDYFEDKMADGTRLADALLAGQDREHDLDDVLRWTREAQRPHFAPGIGRRAHYSDTNFYLLAEAIARAAGLPLDAALARFVTGPLGLSATGFYRAGTPALPLRMRDRTPELPLALESMPVDGGAVSTARELGRFLQGFFDGRLFESRLLAELPDWRRVFFPLQAGCGVLRFRLPRLLSPFRAPPDLVGHSGISGAFAFRDSVTGIILSGTTNQLADRGAPYRLMVRALAVARRHGWPGA